LRIDRARKADFLRGVRKTKVWTGQNFRLQARNALKFHKTAKAILGKAWHWNLEKFGGARRDSGARTGSDARDRDIAKPATQLEGLDEASGTCA
jgi:hypothetical protein